MKTNMITLRPDRLHFPCETLVVGRASSAVAIVQGEIPDDITAIAAVVQYLNGEDETETYTAAATAQDDGTWRLYFAPAYFPKTSNSLRYDIVGTDSSNNPRWLGSGYLRILECPANGSGVAPSIIPAASYAYNPATGLYHKLTAVQNELGEITVDVDPEGVEL